MRHYVKDYYLATCFKTFDYKTVRFVNLGSCCDVGILATDEDELGTAVLKGNNCDMLYDDYTKLIWELCNYITMNIKEDHSAVDFIDGIGSTKIQIKKIDVYTFNITLRVSHRNQSRTNSIILDAYSSWFLSKLASFCSKTFTRKLYG